ncbi:hypothetical protein NEOLEDRAFT_1182748 [Neolentinus lepideus HHB14362 ss-1]|uniref:Zn(2)-C6 fungal-type domain-containing protein n=1 Tax=Neolentinus lepideus HHB14362 ss-1 TaxID=1314782 RepID=A0A165NX19_9AGAM|nr:hypothetical protein NEOLEDRAFT_1182748 [Neolentinus lepideus HHB14362 ss-1]
MASVTASAADRHYSSLSLPAVANQSRLRRPAAAGLNLQFSAGEDMEHHRRPARAHPTHHLRHNYSEGSPATFRPCTHSPLSTASTATFDSAPPTPSEAEDSWNLIPYNVPWGSAYHQYEAGTLPGPEGACIFLRSPTPLKNQRTTQACEKCRERKAKCSGDRPSCARCLARGHTCTYVADAAKRTRSTTLNRRKRRGTLSTSSTPDLSDTESTDQTQHNSDQPRQIDQPWQTDQPRRNSAPDLACPMPTLSTDTFAYVAPPLYAGEGMVQYEFPAAQQQQSIYAPRPMRHAASMPFLPQSPPALGYYAPSPCVPQHQASPSVSQYTLDAQQQQPEYYSSYQAVYDDPYLQSAKESLYGGINPYDAYPPMPLPSFAQPYH